MTNLYDSLQSEIQRVESNFDNYYTADQIHDLFLNMKGELNETFLELLTNYGTGKLNDLRDELTAAYTAQINQLRTELNELRNQYNSLQSEIQRVESNFDNYYNADQIHDLFMNIKGELNESLLEILTSVLENKVDSELNDRLNDLTTKINEMWDDYNKIGRAHV